MIQETEKEISKNVMWPQWVAGIGVTLLQLQIGLITGWSSPYIAYLTSSKSHIPITMHEASWVVSLLNLGRLIGAVTGALSVNYLGSKTTILVTSLPMAVCWIFMIVANQVEWLYAARTIAGISLGMTYSSFSLYVGEIANPKIRGALVVLAINGISIGNLVMSIMGAYLNMDISSAINLLLCIVLILLFLWLPESPHHLIKIKAEEKARTSILWYNRDCDAESELQALKKFIETNNDLPFIDVLKEFKAPQAWKALVLVIILFVYSQLCGLNNVFFYMETILRTAQVTVLSPKAIVIIITGAGVASCFLSMLLIDRFGRKMLMIVSSSAITVSLIILSVEFHLLDAGHDAISIQSLPIIGMLLFQVSVFIGILSVPNTVLGEVFAPHIKCVAACLGSIFAGLFSFISTATYQPLIDLMTEKYVFLLYAIMVITAVPFTIFYMPETKGKSLQEIQEKLMRRD